VASGTHARLQVVRLSEQLSWMFRQNKMSRQKSDCTAEVRLYGRSQAVRAEVRLSGRTHTVGAEVRLSRQTTDKSKVGLE
jgi:hypothetical protein